MVPGVQWAIRWKECILHSLERMIGSSECAARWKERTPRSREWMTHSLDQAVYWGEWLTHSLEWTVRSPGGKLRSWGRKAGFPGCGARFRVESGHAIPDGTVVLAFSYARG